MASTCPPNWKQYAFVVLLNRILHNTVGILCQSIVDVDNLAASRYECSIDLRKSFGELLLG